MRCVWRRTRWTAVLTGVAALALALAAPARQATAASMLLGTTGNGGDISTLVEIDPATGALVRTIGSVGYAVNGLEWDPTTGTLYGTTSVTDAAYNGLITIDLTTGAGTAIGAAGWGLGSASITNLAINAAGEMYGWWDPSMDDLVSIDKVTGIATLVGESGVGTAANGLAFDTAGVLYMVNVGGGYYTVDPITGAATFVGGLGTTAHHGSFQPETNLYYGIDATSGPRSLIVADLLTGTVTATLPTVDELHTLAFITPLAPVPEPSTVVLAASGAAGLALGALRRRRRTR